MSVQVTGGSHLDQTEFYATLVGCIDGKDLGPAQEFIRKWGHERGIAIQHITIISLAGGAASVAGQVEALPEFKGRLGSPLEQLSQAKANVALSAEKHHPVAIFVSSHEECAAKPADQTSRMAMTATACDQIRMVVGPEHEIIGLDSHRDENGQWTSTQVYHLPVEQAVAA